MQEVVFVYWEKESMLSSALNVELPSSYGGVYGDTFGYGGVGQGL